MPMPSHIAPLARAADILETGHYIRATVTEWGFNLEAAKSIDGVDAAIADGITVLLAERGVKFEGPGRPSPNLTNGFPQMDADAEKESFRPAAPPSHMLSTLLRVSSAARHSALLETSGQRDKTRIRSAGGSNAGKSLVASAGLESAHFNDDQFTEVLRWRLGLCNAERIAVCRNLAAKTSEECGVALDCFGDHAASCSYGPLRIKRHDDVADCLSELILETGAHVRREAYVREFSSISQEAWLDIWTFAGLRIQDLLVDVTVRHPMASAYQPGAADADGVAAVAGEGDKAERYPSSGGRRVVPFAMETWGRLGPAAEALLESLAAEATRQSLRRGQATTASAYLRRWRATLDAALQKAMAAALSSARCGLPGRPFKGGRWQG